MATSAVPAAILVRVSTSKQDTARQVSELQSVAAAKGWTVVEVAEEHAVGGSSKIRPGLERVLELARAGEIQKVLVHEVSRVARRNSVAHAFIEDLEELGVSLYWHAHCIETLLPSGKRNPAASIMFALLSDMARAEKETLVERINSGLAAARRKGKTLGRPKGSALPPEGFLAKHSDVVRQLRAGQSVRNTAKITGKSEGTVLKVRRTFVR
jgi:DNA invertase Pin-like site-specific DNA recombinase